MGNGSKFASAISTRGGKLNAINSEDIRANNPLAKEILDDMSNKGIDFTKDKIEFAARLENGNNIFLEKGNEKSGLIHINIRHGDDFSRAFDVDKSNLSSFLYDTITKGKLVSSIRRDGNGKEGYRSVYYYQGKRTVVFSIAGNGYIVESRPGKKYGGN
jgi:hypothetical protein